MNVFDVKKAYEAGSLTKQQFIDEMHSLHQRLFDYPALMRDTDIAEMRITAEGVVATMKHSGIRMLCDPADKRIIPIEILNFGSFERQELDIVEQLLLSEATVFDIGANVGWYSLNLAKAFPGLRIHAFEPIPTTFAILERNVALNDTANIVLHNFGFSDRTQTIPFYFSPACSGNASSVNVSGHESVRVLPCPVRRLDDFMVEKGERVDFIKCDVEGAELLVFQGAVETLRRDKPVIFTEMLRKWAAQFGYHPNEIIRLLGTLGYRCFVARTGGLWEFESMGEHTTETNFFFLHADKHAKFIAALQRSQAD